MTKHSLLFFALCFLLTACDIKKSSISGTVVSRSTGKGVAGVLINFVQCKSNGENCSEVVIGQMYTAADGSFIISEKTGSKSKTTWITAYKDGKKLAQKDNVGLNDKNIRIELP
jgi:hypothetical protein